MGNPHFTGKSVVITGASSGIGAALAREFVRQGASVTVTARRLELVSRLAEELNAAGGVARAYRCDVTRDDDVSALFAALASSGVAVDVVVANAGFGVSGRFQDLTLSDYQRQFETNVYGVLRTVYAALPALRADLRPDGIGVTLISPGFVDSDIRRTDNHGQVHATAPDPVPGWLRVPTQRAARDIVRAVYRRRREAVITGHGKLLVWVYRHCPWLLNGFLDSGRRVRDGG